MHARWADLHQTFTRYVSAPAATASFGLLASRSTALAAFKDALDLATAFREIATTEEQLTTRNHILRALVLAVHAGPGEPPRLALALLWLALWPALTAILRRCAARTGDIGEALSDLSERFITAVLRLRPEKVSRIAATLVWNTERNVADLRRRRARHRMRESASADADLAVPALTAGQEVKEICDWAVAIVGGDAVLVVEVALAGRTYEEVVATTGLSAEAVRKRVKRAYRRLREQVSADFSRKPVRIAALPAHEPVAGPKPAGGL
jgi:RNA polymerase sigma factor (sigma-70 family)